MPMLTVADLSRADTKDTTRIEAQRYIENCIKASKDDRVDEFTRVTQYNKRAIQQAAALFQAEFNTAVGAGKVNAIQAIETTLSELKSNYDTQVAAFEDDIQAAALTLAIP